MSKEPGGLLSRMVKFVRNPATNWAELDQRDPEEDSTQARANLKEIMERKRRNDFVRKREFDMLRKIRQREALGGGGDGNARPSFFQSSMPSKPDDRAQTLKKIDEIEAQMSMQWWKTNVPNSALPSSSAPHSAAMNAAKAKTAELKPPGTSPNAYARTEPVPLSPQAESEGLGSSLGGRGSIDFSAEGLGLVKATPSSGSSVNFAASTRSRDVNQPPGASSAAPSLKAHSPVIAAPVKAAVPTPVRQAPVGASTSFSTSNFFAVDVEEVQHDADHEEAAIRFANGDDSAAEAALLDALSPSGAHQDHVETWLTLFDFYRATGNQTSFDNKGLDFAGRFGRSPPAWVSLPEQVAKMMGRASPDAAQALSMSWTSPSVVGIQTVVALRTTLAKTEQPWRLDWSKIKTIEPAAYEPLAMLLASWAGQPVRLEFLGLRSLDAVLNASTVSGHPEQLPAAWKTRMELQRVSHRPDEFEVTALDYCVTYEVSPPSWEAVRCNFKTLDPDSHFGGSTIIGEAFRDSLPSAPNSNFGDTSMGPTSSQFHQTTVVELAGQILGDATLSLDKLQHKLLGADLMSISCAKLIRVDFSAAGTLLNWVSARQAEGRMVQFTDVNRLVAAFFHVIGIGEHARVVPRRD